mmetsp:Transcript_58923/g.105082  ORF Transcript_58923/g.105082 Transcript_58923/m.105082 type:complete len:110 (-) Transcript_58923:344-673(-)
MTWLEYIRSWQAWLGTGPIDVGSLCEMSAQDDNRQANAAKMLHLIHDWCLVRDWHMDTTPVLVLKSGKPYLQGLKHNGCALLLAPSTGGGVEASSRYAYRIWIDFVIAS